MNAIIEMNPDAFPSRKSSIGSARRRVARGPLHGIPILIKDNIDTADRMMTTAGSLALVGSKPPKDSLVAQKLRAAGAVILGKTNLSEWANIRSTHSTSGWSGRGGLTKILMPWIAIPADPVPERAREFPRTSPRLGSARKPTARLSVPSSLNGLAGIKPTVGLVSRAGIIPISHSQDTAGPMCRTVRDAATLLGVLTGGDPEDRRRPQAQARRKRL